MLIPTGVNRPLYSVPGVTIALVIINVLIHIGQVVSDSPDSFQYQMAYTPGYGSLFHLFSHMFAHAGWGHLIGNMVFLILTGFKCEDALGHIRFFFLYFGCGVAANALHLALSNNVPIPCLGASGAIAGIMGGSLILYPFMRLKTIVFLHFYVFPLQIPFWIVLGGFFVKDFLVMINDKSEFGNGVAVAAHVGGFIAGAVWVWAFFGWNKGFEMDEPEDELESISPMERSHEW